VIGNRELVNVKLKENGYDIEMVAMGGDLQHRSMKADTSRKF
jgi:hypothetical protein